MKSNRQNLILSLISKQEIETQNQLLEALQRCGVKTTQATLSRDIKELHLIKTLSAEGKYRYSAPTAEEQPRYDDRLRKIFRESVTSYAAAQNLVVLKTLPGLASGAASTLDGMDYPDLVGTLAGDDTVLLVMQNNMAAEALCEEIEKML